MQRLNIRRAINYRLLCFFSSTRVTAEITVRQQPPGDITYQYTRATRHQSSKIADTATAFLAKWTDATLSPFHHSVSMLNMNSDKNTNHIYILVGLLKITNKNEKTTQSYVYIPGARLSHHSLNYFYNGSVVAL